MVPTRWPEDYERAGSLVVLERIEGNFVRRTLQISER